MASARTLARIQACVWVLIYGGLLILVLGLAVGRIEPVLGGVMAFVGAVLAFSGAVLLWVRSRLKQDKP